MQVQVKLYASLSRYAPGGRKAGAPFIVEVCEAGSIRYLLEALRIPAQEAKVAFVNGLVQTQEWTLRAGDQVGIFPPVGGAPPRRASSPTWAAPSTTATGWRSSTCSACGRCSTGWGRP